jgi:3-oxoacyl-[acyl-carrier protein] reductase
MDLGLDGKIAMVAAASKGLGRACAEALAAEGCRVSICARSAADLDAVPGAALRVVADVTRAADLERWHAETEAGLGAADILVTNGGGPPVARFMELDDGRWAAGIESTLMNVVRMCRRVIPGMQARRWGRIVHITSFVARQPMDELTISSTLRAGLSALTRTQASQLGRDGITVNAVLPGNVLTARQEHLADLRSRERGVTREVYLQQVAAEIPVGRIGAPHEVGEVVAFLCSARAAYVTGVSLPVDGGLIKGTF